MTKIEKFNQEKSEHEQLQKSFRLALNLDNNPSNDKHHLSVEDYDWHDNKMSMNLLAYHGYYGNSGCTWDGSTRMRKYMMQAINLYMKDLAQCALRLSEKDMENARLAAVAEANEVLQITS